MFKLAAGCEDERVLVIGRLVRRLELRRDQLGHAVRPRKALVEHHVAAWFVGRIARIRDVILALDALPADVVESRHQVRHLGIDLADVLVVPFLA